MKLKELSEASKIGPFAKSVQTANNLAIDHQGNFTVSNAFFTSLKGSPETVSGNFSCSYNELKTLDFAPKKVGGDFNCNNNKLKSLKGCAAEIGGDLNVAMNLIDSLVGCPPKIGGAFYCYDNDLITSLEGIPSHIGSDLQIPDCKITSLKGIHKQIKHIGGFANFVGNPIKSHILGLLRIEGLQEVAITSNNKVNTIINKHLKNGRDILACQDELIEAGFEEFAQL